jgi:nucleoside permease NupC
MRFFGILGLGTLLGIAFVLSNNRKAIKLRILLWGTGLQILFASIILSESCLSWTGMTVLAALITFYTFREQLASKKNRIAQILFSIVLAALLISAIAIFYFLDSLKITQIYCGF